MSDPLEQKARETAREILSECVDIGESGSGWLDEAASIFGDYPRERALQRWADALDDTEENVQLLSRLVEEGHLTALAARKTEEDQA